MFNRPQFQNLIQRVLLDYEGLFSAAAVELLLGTAAQESQFGHYLRQLGSGPAIGVFQMEPATFRWLKERFGKQYGFKGRQAEEMEWDIRLAILLARLRYRVVEAPLPKAGDLAAQAAYWKQWYNTPAGRGTVEEYEDNFRKYVRAA